MSTLNVEIKARCSNPLAVREYLLAAGAEFRGTDHQLDTYFNVHKGRLKLRQGTIENNLIYYERGNQQGPKQSAFRLVKVPDAKGLKAALAASCGIKTVVDKQRGIYYIGNVKFHIDEVKGLGGFVEIEAFNEDGRHDVNALQGQCNFYMQELGIQGSDLVAVSYSDLLLDKPDN